MGFGQVAPVSSTQASHWKGHFKLLGIEELNTAKACQLFPGLRLLVPPRPHDAMAAASVMQKATDVAFLALSDAGTVVLLHHGRFDAKFALDDFDSLSEGTNKLWFVVGLDTCMDGHTVNPEDFKAVTCNTPSMAALKAAKSPEDLKALAVQECLSPGTGVEDMLTLACSSVVAIPAFLVDAWETAVSRKPEEVAFQTLHRIREFDMLQKAMSVSTSSQETSQQENLAEKYLEYIPAFLWACAAGKVTPLTLYPNHLPSCRAWVKSIHDMYLATSIQNPDLLMLRDAQGCDERMDAKSWVEDEPNSERVTVHSVIPHGLSIGCGEFGRCLIATTFFKAGSMIFRGYCQLKDTAATSHQYALHLHAYDSKVLVGKFILDDNHSVTDLVQQGRKIYGFDGFINHSCYPNAKDVIICRTKEMISYETIALRDIYAGDEITVDYALFDYDCSGHEMPVCRCGTAKCRGFMKGFVNLDIDEQVRIMHLCEDDIIEAFCKQKNIMLLPPSQVPHGFKLIEENGGNFFLVADRMFEKDELVFEDKSQIIPKGTLAEETRLIQQVNWGCKKLESRYFLLDKDRHLASRNDYYECFGFDTFMGHSCDPNTVVQYNSFDSYSVFATRTVSPGEKVTCDYEQRANEANRQNSFS